MKLLNRYIPIDGESVSPGKISQLHGYQRKLLNAYSNTMTNTIRMRENNKDIQKT